VAEPELLAIGQQAQEISRILAAGDNQDISNARIHHGLDRVIDHRLFVDGQQVLVGDLGQRKEPASRAAR